ncbi:hypothetical protein HHI36_012258 [Cryptolaemus montrouzieri]|uniref:Uncharacterized protein n=1 Tax=Cryptolaemus montrouzieri TaxID=559131 RepID=A0ABD2NEF8_9CUCU
MDETTFFFNLQAIKVLAAKGEKSTYQKVNVDEKECYTVLLGGNAVGEITSHGYLQVDLRFRSYADYFLQGGCGSHYMYLETIQEETSDDLRSESDLSEAGTSPAGWFGTDSETGSVICIEKDPTECDSDRESACPAKRRKQDNNLLTISIEDDCQSLSRSSSLLQFETLEKQCQETCNSSPSVYSQFSFDSLDVQRKSNVSPDSLDRVQSDGEQESDYYRALKIDVPRKKESKTLQNVGNRFGGSDSSDSDGTLGGSRSFDNLRSWRSFDSLPILSVSPPKTKDEVSVENLSEDSGYSDHLCNNSKYNITTSQSETGMKSNFDVSRLNLDLFGNKKSAKTKTAHVDFHAYDGEGFHSFSGNFGTSYQDLSVFDKYDVDILENHHSPLIDRFMRRRVRNEDSVTKIVNIEKSPECGLASKYNCASSASEPNLLVATTVTSESVEVLPNSQKKTGKFLENSACASSVPKDLNLVKDLETEKNTWCFDAQTESVAAKNFDIADLTVESVNIEDINSSSFHSSNISEFLSLDNIENKGDMSSFRREGSYAEAMTNRVDLSDDENSLIAKPILKRPRNTMEDFDRKVLKAISEHSIQSIGDSRHNLCDTIYPSNPIANSIAKQSRYFTSTPNVSSLSRQKVNNYEHEERRKSTYDVRRTDRSTSTSGMSDFDDKTITSAKSLAESTSSKGVHFSPLVDEVNWNDDTTESTETIERESSYSLQSSPERETSPPSPTPVERLLESPEPGRMSYSQPDLHNHNEKRDFIESLKCFQTELTKSQPNMNDKLKRRGSQLLKKDKDGCLIKAYVDGDGIHYQHTHLDLDNVYSNKPPTSPTTSDLSHVGSNTASMQAKPVVGMAARARDVTTPRKDKGKFGGFFSRLTSFRFSARKDAAKKKNGNVAAKENVPSDLLLAPPVRQATKDDYVYIPLKGPSSENNNRRKDEGGKVSGKPPVPRAPPRVVGASVKRDGGGANQQGGGVESHERRRRRTIDSGSRPRPMEPMGLIETDLDTEVTIITDGADVKTRSLLNLGAAQPSGTARLQLSTAPRETHRPHKSMEFLLDKENIKVVEVS